MTPSDIYFYICVWGGCTHARVCVYMCLSVYLCCCQCLLCVWSALKLELRTALSHPVCVLGAELASSGRANSLTHQDISLDPGMASQCCKRIMNPFLKIETSIS